jgi:hypothetical protein
MNDRYKIDFTKKYLTKEEKAVSKAEVEIIMEKKPDHVPVIIKSDCNKNPITLKKRKFLVNGSMTFGHFQDFIRRRSDINVKPHEAIFFFADNMLIPTTDIMSNIYKRHRDEESGLLFFTICRENTFGLRKIKK